MVKLVGLVKRETVPLTRSGTVNPELVPIIEAAIAAKDTDDFVEVECKDKKELERIRESLRGQIKSRGFNAMTATDTKVTTVNIKRGGKRTGEKKQVIRYLIYLGVYSKPKPVAENETVVKKPKKSKVQTNGEATAESENGVVVAK